jgi:O-acetyl-ADP-ribose deacetylase (regulator of RNase III)
MIRITRSELADARVGAVLRPVTAEWSAVTPAMRRVEVAAGPVVEAHCRRMGDLPVGSAVLTPAGDLPAEFMVHVIVRSADEGVTAAGVRRGLRNGLRRLAEWKIDSVAMAPLGTGAGNLDAEESARLMIPLLLEHVQANEAARIEIVVESDYELEIFERALDAASSSGDGEAEKASGSAA